MPIHGNGDAERMPPSDAIETWLRNAGFVVIVRRRVLRNTKVISRTKSSRCWLKRPELLLHLGIRDRCRDESRARRGKAERGRLA